VAPELCGYIQVVAYSRDDEWTLPSGGRSVFCGEAQTSKFDDLPRRAFCDCDILDVPSISWFSQFFNSFYQSPFVADEARSSSRDRVHVSGS